MANAPGPDWPKGVKIFGDKMYQGEKLCVPEKFVARVVREHHEAATWSEYVFWRDPRADTFVLFCPITARVPTVCVASALCVKHASHQPMRYGRRST